MTAALDLPAYLRRIGFEGAVSANLQTLQALHALHPAAICFENLDARFGVTPSLDLPDLQRKMVAGRRGGWCFEHNTLFEAILKAVGFQVEPLIARVRWGAADDAPPTPRTHKLLQVMIDQEPWLADVGFGGPTLTAPLRIQPGLEQQTPHERVRLVQGAGHLEQQVLLGSDWAPTYRFTLEPAAAVDYELGNWYHSTHPASQFTLNLIAARALPGRRLNLLNTQLTIRTPDGGAERRRLASASELEACLSGDFGLDLPAYADLDAVVSALV